MRKNNRASKRINQKTNQSIPKVVLPHQNQISNYISIPKVAIKYAAGIVCLLMVLSVGFMIKYHKESVELERLRQNNQSQLEQIEQLSQATISLQSDMERLNILDAEIRSLVNNENTTTSRAGVVRPTVYSQDIAQEQFEIDDISYAVSQLQVTMKLREQSLTELKEELLAKKARMAVTPSIWPTKGEVTSRFGRRDSPTGSDSEFHPGIDIASTNGTPIVATADGTVVYSGWQDGGYGKMVEIDHSNGIVTIYGHNSEIVVFNGQVVKKGQIIAYMGTTGYSTGPHVHYEIRVNGTAVDPVSFLK